MKQKNIATGGFIVVVFLIFVFLNFSSIKILYLRIFHKTGAIVHLDDKGRFDGEILGYVDGKLSAKSNWKNGLREGYIYLFYKNGQLKNQTFYRNNKIEAAEYEYYENGKIHYIQNWKNGKYKGSGYNYTDMGVLEVYGTSDTGNVFYYSEYDKSGKILKVLGNVVSPNIFSLDRRDSVVLLTDNKDYSNIEDLYIDVATPPNLNLRLTVNINNKNIGNPVVKDNVVKIVNAFPNTGRFFIYIEGQLIDSKKRVIKADTLKVIINKI